MAKKPKTLGDRVRHLLSTRWGDNQTAMASDVGCSQSTLSQVANGKEPGKRLLTMIANHEAINQDWLFHGQGDPLSTVRPTLNDRIRLPVLTKPLRSGVDSASAPCSGWREAPPEHGETCYWLEVQPGEPILGDEGLGVLPRDLLLVETDRELFPQTEKMFQRICVVQISSQPQLGLVDYVVGSPDEGPSHLEVDTFDLGAPDDQITWESIVVEHRGRRQRIAVPVRNHAGKKVQVSDVEIEPSSHRITAKDVVGVCMQLVRRRL